MSDSSLLSVRKVVRVNKQNPDPSLDLAVMDVDAYAMTRNQDLIVMKEGERPDLFVIGRIPGSILMLLKHNGKSLSENALLGFRVACHRVELANGDILEASDFIKEKIGSKIVHTAKEDWFDTVLDRFGYDTILEMGQVAIDHAGLPLGADGPFLCWVGTVHPT
jgi:hypothetical protein